MEQDLGLFKFLFHLFYPLDILEKKKKKKKKKLFLFHLFCPPSRGGGTPLKRGYLKISAYISQTGGDGGSCDHHLPHHPCFITVANTLHNATVILQVCIK